MVRLFYVKEIETNRNIAYSSYYHVVSCPKYRRKVLVPPIDERLKTIVLVIIDQWRQEFIVIEVMPDHVHLLVECDPQFGIHRLVKYLKGASSHALRQEFPELKPNCRVCGLTVISSPLLAV